MKLECCKRVTKSESIGEGTEVSGEQKGDFNARDVVLYTHLKALRAVEAP